MKKEGRPTALLLELVSVALTCACFEFESLFLLANSLLFVISPGDQNKILGILVERYHDSDKD
jgi:hypothetical protein